MTACQFVDFLTDIVIDSEGATRPSFQENYSWTNRIACYRICSVQRESSGRSYELDVGPIMSRRNRKANYSRQCLRPRNPHSCALHRNPGNRPAFIGSRVYVQGYTSIAQAIRVKLTHAMTPKPS